MSTSCFTIIIVVFNGEKTIQQAIDSISCQTFTDYELLVIDGGSTDSTINIILENIAINKRIKFVTEEDEGIYDAMNKGIKMAKGDWVYFLGSDDRMYDKYVLEKIALIISRQQCEMIYGDVILLPGKKKYGRNFQLKELLKKNICHQGIFYKASVFEKIGNYNLMYKTHADWDYNIRCFLNAQITHQYFDLIIAFFKKGGASSQYDKPFLREVLMPLFTANINSNARLIKNIGMYDEYWRLLRNSNIRSEKELLGLLGNNKPINAIFRIIHLQQNLSIRLLKNGFFSKLFMAISYLQNNFLGFK